MESEFDPLRYLVKGAYLQISFINSKVESKGSILCYSETKSKELWAKLMYCSMESMSS